MSESTTQPVSRRLRFEILRRDNHTCRYCGSSAPDVELTVDHVTPVSLGGTNEPTNLVAACYDCNAGKASTSPDNQLVADVDEQAQRWSAAMQQAAARLAERDREADDYVQQVDEAWCSYYTKSSGTIWRPGDWQASLRQFRQAGLPVEAAVEAVAVAMGQRKVAHNDVWRYFCGICWRKVSQLQTIATQIVQENG